MTDAIKPRWLEWAQEIQALAQIGDTYAENEWQHERYLRLMAIAAEIVNSYTGLPFESLLENFQVQPGYATPKIDVRGAVFRDQKVLLVQERSDRNWTLPGGWADVVDNPSGAVEREVLEESGFTVKAKRLVGVYDANRFQPLKFYHAYKLVFLCNILEGFAQVSNETVDVAFFAQDDIPTNFSGERTGQRHIDDAFRMHKDPSHATVFD